MGKKERPRLPYEIEQKLPECLLRYLYTFVPKTSPSPPPSPSPSLQREITALQKRSPPSKKAPMYLFGLDDFVLD